MASLTDSERAALRLLAQGHDTKSAAAQLGITVHALNERLREARRKLGVTSSREAARRLLAEERGAQEICPEFSGDAQGAFCAEGMARRANRRAVIAGVGIMSAVVFAALAWSLAGAGAGASAQPPQVVASSPAQGSIVAAGPFTLSVTFDQPMQSDSFSVVQTDPATFPQCARMPVQSADRRTFSLACRAQPGGQYEVWFNRGRWQNFKNLRGQPATPYRLTFRTAP